MANFLAQTEALMKGRGEAEAEAELRAEGLSEEEVKHILMHKVQTHSNSQIERSYSKIIIFKWL